MQQNGTAPAEEYLGGMQLQAYKKLVARIERAADNGIPRNPEHAREFTFREGGHAWLVREFKVFGHRITWDWGPGGELVLLHGFTKQSDSTPKTELRRAARFIESLREESEQP
ncbi:MAG TPA: type II toxin-antitoxin system RelE/ParE family toxin [Tepidiformaceae bacterium]|nr:type II toxin-antitoxin system RelE/ParE family toxin [Tepidiformaceae bacterium]